MLRLGQIVATPGAIEVMGENDVMPHTLLNRYTAYDWGDLDEEDKKSNDLAVKEGDRILAAYILGNGKRVWVITEWDRSVTTLLLPEEY